MDTSYSVSNLSRPPVRYLGRIRHPYINALILFFANVINYTDRYTLSGIIAPIKEEFHIRNDLSGILQSAFTFTYMIAAPIMGYFGDRYSRKILLALCTAIWALAQLAGSFSTHYITLVATRVIFGIGEAGFVAVAPTILSDLFIGDERSKMLGLFYLAIPFGNGLSIIVSAEMFKATHQWQWSFRVTPGISLIFVILILFIEEPERGKIERRSEDYSENTSLYEDVKTLVKNRSYVSSTLAFTCLAFATGVFYYWGPELYYLGRLLTEKSDERTQTIFGIISIFSGVLGLYLGYVLSYIFKPKYARTDPIICSVGLLISAPMLAVSIVVVSSKFAMYFLLFMAQVAMNLNWAILVHIMFAVVSPNKRALACGLQMFIGHSLGDTASPYVMGLMSDYFEDYLKRKFPKRDLNLIQFQALEYSFFLPCLFLFFGGIFFLITACYIVKESINYNPDEVLDSST